MLFQNPLITEEMHNRFKQLPPEAKQLLYEFLTWLYRYANDKAELSWRTKKAPMAVYWSAVKAWAFHLKNAIKRFEPELQAGGK